MNFLQKYFICKTPTVFIFSAISYGWSLPANAYDDAYCVLVNGWGSGKVFNVTLPKISTSQDTPNGTILFQTTQYFPVGPYIETCDRSSAIFTDMYTYVDSEGIAPTTVPGVGVRIMNTVDGRNGAHPLWYTSIGNTMYWTGNWWARLPFMIRSGYGFRFELIKTGTISPGNFRTGTYGYITEAKADTSPQIKRLIARIDVTGGGSVSTAACEVENKSITVPMGDVKRSEFTAVGSTAANKTFNIFLNCDASTNIKMTLTATSDSSKAPGVIALNSASGRTVANGVGIQLLNNNNPVTLGAPITIGTAPSGSSRVEMVARYYQTKSTVTAGEANGTATFTFTYN